MLSCCKASKICWNKILYPPTTKLYHDKLIEDVVIRHMEQTDIDTADKLFRKAFYEYLGFDKFGDADYVRSRSQYATACYVAELNDQIVGSHFTTNWGSFQFRGPMTVDPQHQSKKIAQKLIDAVFDNMSSNKNVKSYGLFTFPNSSKHLYLYNKKGFKPKYLTPILSKSIDTSINYKYIDTDYEYDIIDGKKTNYEKNAIIEACQQLTNDI
eukprot:UN04718